MTARLRGDPVRLGVDAGPSLLMVAVCCWLLLRRLRLPADTFDAVRPTFWPDENGPLPAIMRP